MGFLRKEATGKVTLEVQLWPKGLRKKEFLVFRYRCRKTAGSLQPAFLENYLCRPPEGEYLTHRMDPFQLGLFPLGARRIGEKWRYDLDYGKRGGVRAEYTLKEVRGRRYRVDAKIQYREVLGMPAREQSVEFRGEIWIGGEDEAVEEVRGEFRAGVKPVSRLLSFTAADVQGKLEIRLRRISGK